MGGVRITSAFISFRLRSVRETKLAFMRKLGAGILMAVAVTACGPSAGTTNTFDAELPEDCRQATSETLEVLEAILDHIDTNGSLDAEFAEENANKVGDSAARACGNRFAGEAFSEFVIYLAAEAKVRTIPSQAFVAQAFDLFCSPELTVELNVQARNACEGRT